MASTLQSFDNFNPQPLSADGFFGNLTTFPPIGSGIYHAGSADFIHRFARGIYLRANYTYSKNIDNATNELFSSRVNPRRAQDAFDFAAERGLSALDIRQKFALSFLYEIPNVQTDHAFVKALAHGWEWGGTYLAESGQPVSRMWSSSTRADVCRIGQRDTESHGNC